MLEVNKIYNGDCRELLKKLDDESIDCVISSPPYWSLRDYGIPAVKWDDGWEGTLGLEPTFEMYIKHLADIYDDVKRVLKKSGTCWVNLGDTYSAGGGSGSKEYFEKGHKQFGKNDPEGKYQAPKKVKGIQPKCLLMIPQRFAIEMIDRGWILRNVIIWHKPSCMPESAKDRFTRDFEYVYFFVKNKKYWFERQREPMASSSKKRIKYSYKNKRVYDLSVHKERGNPNQDQIREGRKEMHQTCDIEKGRNKRTVWSINPKGTKEAHFATFPPDLIEPMIKAGCPEFICEVCGTPRRKILMKIQGTPDEIYEGQGIKDYKSAKAQNPSDTKRRVLQSMAMEQKVIGYECDCKYDKSKYNDKEHETKHRA